MKVFLFILRPALYYIYMNNNYFLLICLLLIPVSLLAGETELDRLCAPYFKVHTPLDKNYENYPYADGLIWEVSKNSKTNFIYGTIHTQDMMATRFPAKVRLGIYRSQTYLMEIMLNQESNDIFRKAMFYKDGQSLEGKIDPVLIQVLGNQLVDYGYEKTDAKRIKPWAAYSTIGAPKPIRAYTLDQVLMNFAISRGNKIIGIETMQELVESMASVDETDQITILEDTICNRPTIVSETRNLVEMHMHDNLLGMVKFNEQPHHDERVFERYMQAMVYDRNKKMLQRILPYFEKGSAFAAVGALHLPGEKGLLKLLADEGFVLENLK